MAVVGVVVVVFLLQLERRQDVSAVTNCSIAAASKVVSQFSACNGCCWGGGGGVSAAVGKAAGCFCCHQLQHCCSQQSGEPILCM